MDAFHMIVPCLLREPLVLKAHTGWGILFRGRFASDRRPRSIKFPVAPESINVVVLMVCFLMSSLTGKQRVLSLSEATSTWDRDWECSVEVASHFKNPGQGWRQQRFPPLVLQSTSGGLGGFWPRFSLEFSMSLQRHRWEKELWCRLEGESRKRDQFRQHKWSEGKGFCLSCIGKCCGQEVSNRSTFLHGCTWPFQWG